MSNDHHHHHDHDSHNEIPFGEKLLKMLNPWIKHNEDHTLNYRNWVEKAKTNGHEEASALLEEAAEMSLAVNESFQKALALIGLKQKRCLTLEKLKKDFNVNCEKKYQLISSVLIHNT